MDPRERADAALARARARGAFVVTPDDAVSPMDAASTLQIPRAVVHAAEQSESTGRVIPTGTTRGHLPPQQPMQQQQMPPQQPRHHQPTQYLQPVQSHQPPQPAQQQGHPPQRGHQTGPHQPVPYPGPPQQQQQQQPARPEPQPEPQPQYDEPPRQLDGLVPTTQQPGTQRSMMSRRLDGH